MNLSKSKYCSGIQCSKILWLDKYKREYREEIDNESVLENGTIVGEIAKSLFGEYIDIEFNENLNKMIEDTNEALKNDKCVITEASFVFDNNFCSVDILVKNGEELAIYEVKSSTHVSEVYMEDISYQYHILKSLNLNVKKASLVYINSNYVRHGDLELDKLFIIEDLTDYVIENEINVINNILSINEYMTQKDEPFKDIDNYCFQPYLCPYFKYCGKKLGEMNVFNIRGMQIGTKIKLYKKGIYKYEDLIKSGVINSVKVDRYALLNATSIAATIITMGGVIVEENDVDSNVLRLEGTIPAGI